MSSNASNPAPGVLPRINVLSRSLQPAPVGSGPTTGFFRNNYCDASPLDPGSHTVAAYVSPAFLEFSASRGNDLRPLFPTSGPTSPANGNCVWCLCAARWYEALRFSRNDDRGEKIVPKVVLEATHADALKVIPKEDLFRFAADGTGSSNSDQGGGQQVYEKPGR